MTMESFLCLPAWGAFETSTSRLCFHLWFHDKCTGNGGPGANEYCATMDRLGLGLVGLEGDALGSSALLARDRNNQLFLSLGRQQFQAETARQTFGRLNFGDGCNYVVNGSCLQRWRQEKPCRMSRNLLAGAPTCSCMVSRNFSFMKNPPRNCVFVNKEGHPHLV
jgi:hypothetical protein